MVGEKISTVEYEEVFEQHFRPIVEDNLDTPVTMFQGDEYGFFLDDLPEHIGADIRLIDSDYTVGTDDGFNVSFTALGSGGGIIGDLTPYNYTENVWTRDMADLECRVRRVVRAVNDWVENEGWDDV